MGMSLPHGGHLSHGAAVNHSGVIWRAVHYGVDPATGRIDYDVVREQAKREQPKLIIAGGSAYARIIDFAAFRSIADEVGAIFLVDMAHFAGLVAGGRPSVARAARADRHQHHAQDAARPAGGTHPLDRRARQGDRQVGVPGDAGRPARARDRRQGGRLRRGADARLPRLRPPGGGERQGAGRGARRARLRDRVRRHRHAPHAGRSPAQGPHRQGGREDARPGRHHGQQEHHSRTTLSRRSSPAASASARPRSPRAAWARPKWFAWPS